MSRARSTYADGAKLAGPAEGFSVEQPTPGLYRMRLVSGGFPVAIRIWWGPPVDPETGDVMDRSWRFQASINDEPADIDDVWPRCAGDPIDQAEHDHLCATAAWAKDHAPQSPQANPKHRINRLTAPILL